ncbi:uncharacterized protein LOC129751327 [Uranotaenia lowii]|uniref:uncharacterized protein LOC129751327 n=1 Tax=Uranotaenia lowii TaxID=190385 RepID=UPI002478BD57|nr:uncharacterized protein LOC129751327 [Uranotaenia lowii]
MSNRTGSVAGNRRSQGGIEEHSSYTRQIFTEWQEDDVVNRRTNINNNNYSSSSDDEFVNENLVQLISKNQKPSLMKQHDPNEINGGDMLNFENISNIPQSPGHYARSTYLVECNNSRFNTQERMKNVDHSMASTRGLMASHSTLGKGSRTHRNGNNTINRRLMPTGQPMLTSSSSTISSVSNNIERDRDSKDLTMPSNRRMPEEPRYYVMESDIQPPDPAPPEVPQRAHSLYSTSKSSMSIRKKSDYVLKIDKNGDQTHEEYIPSSQQECLRSSSPNNIGYHSRSPTFNDSQQSNSELYCY